MKLENFYPNLAYIRECWAKDAILATKEGLPFLVAKGQEGIYQAGFITGDQGLYYLFQLLVYYFGFDYSQCLWSFYILMVGVPFLFSLVVIPFLVKGLKPRLYAYIFLILMLLVTLQRGGVRIVVFPLVVGVFFLTLFWEKRVGFQNKWTIVLFFLLGILFSFSNWISGFNWLGSFIFLFVYLEIKRVGWKRIFLFLVAFILGWSLWLAHERQVYSVSRNFLRTTKLQKIPHYQRYFDTHPFWQIIYMYLSFLYHPELPQPRDWYMIEKLQKKYGAHLLPFTQPLDDAARKELIFFIKTHPFFFLKQLWAKIGVLIFYFLLFCNIGIIYIYQTGWQKEYGAFLGGMFFYSLIGLATMPDLSYVLGFLLYSSLWSVYAYWKYKGVI